MYACVCRALNHVPTNSLLSPEGPLQNKTGNKEYGSQESVYSNIPSPSNKRVVVNEAFSNSKPEDNGNPDYEDDIHNIYSNPTVYVDFGEGTGEGLLFAYLSDSLP